MAYFPNGTAHEAWAVENCNKCANYYHLQPEHPDYDAEKNCPIELAHLLFNYESEAHQEVLDVLIPQTKDGLGAEQCRMFRPKNDGFVCENCKKDYYGPPMSGDENYWENQIKNVERMNGNG